MLIVVLSNSMNTKICFYPASVHHCIFSNDKKLHGAAKEKWRSMFTSLDNDVECSIALMNCLDSLSKDGIRDRWVNELFITNGIVGGEKYGARYLEFNLNGSVSKMLA